MSKQQVMEDQPSRKHVAYRITLRRHVLNVDNLRRHKPWSATSDKEVFFSIGKSSQPKVTNHRIRRILVPEHDILWFEVSVNDLPVSEVVQASENVTNDVRLFVV